MSEYYDRQGNPLDMFEWAEMLEDGKQKRVAETTLPDGKWVSTVWLGLNHRFGPGPPLIFETMVFRRNIKSLEDAAEMQCRRYATEGEAMIGHMEVVQYWMDRIGESDGTKEEV